jgi:hypothetical protein
MWALQQTSDLTLTPAIAHAALRLRLRHQRLLRLGDVRK